jgi:hypothetical protein
LSTQEENRDALVARRERVIFSRGEENFSARDVIDWALALGGLGALWTDFLRVVECDRCANEQELDDDAVDEAAVAFRYRHDLITAEETERWLADRGLTLTEFGEYFARRYWAQNYDSEIDIPDHSYSTATAEEKDLFLVDLIVSDKLDRLAEEMSFRLASEAEEKANAGFREPTSAAADASTMREQFVAREGISDLGEWLERIGRDEKWLYEILAAEEAFQRRSATIVDEKALERELLGMRLNLTRFELEIIEVDSRDAAAEVMACVRSDGMQMSEIAEESRYPFRETEVMLEDLPPEQQQSFLSVRAGALLEPVAREDGFEVCRVKTRVDPSLSDARVRDSLREQISRRHFSELVSRHIDWKLLQPTGGE